jgi:methylene-fatty-acyl-phospholipid synthase
MPEDRAWALLWSALLLAPERGFYVWLTRAPAHFRLLCAGLQPRLDPVAAVRWLFYGFKTIQVAVLAWWCGLIGPGPLGLQDPIAMAIGALVLAAGQVLNGSAFYRLGAVGILYGGQLGRTVPHADGFPYSIFKHPQYVGVVLSIWGLFLMLQFPHAEWWVLPTLETVYYALGGHFERVHA